jgi:ParB/RepB/Spo0J family partition protein
MATDKIALSKITPAPFQPRKEFDQEKLQELADSLQEQGLIEPVVVRPHNGAFQLIAGERRFRAAKLLGWKEIPALVRELSDIEAMEISFIENLQREDLTFPEKERMTIQMYDIGKKAGRYATKEDMARKLGYKSGGSINKLFASGLLREEENIPDDVSPQIITSTKSLSKEDRGKVIELTRIGVKEGGLPKDHEDLLPYVRVIKDAEEKGATAVKDAILERSSRITPKVAEGLSNLPKESQAGTIAAIKKGKMDEDKAVQLTKTVKESTGQVKEAVLENPDRFTSKVAEGISKLSTPEAQKSTIDAIKKHRLEENEAVQLAKMMEGQMAYAKEHEKELEEKAREFADLLKKWKLEQAKDQSTPGRIRVGHAFRNIMAHMGIVHEIESSSGSCTCPHCGKEASEYLRWTCCDEGKNETLAEAFEDAKRQHETIVKEETKKTVRWK